VPQSRVHTGLRAGTAQFLGNSLHAAASSGPSRLYAWGPGPLCCSGSPCPLCPLQTDLFFLALRPREAHACLRHRSYFHRAGHTKSLPATPLLAELPSILESVRKAAVSHAQLQCLAGSAGPRPPPGSRHPEGSPGSGLGLWPCLWGDGSPSFSPFSSPASPAKS